MSDPYNPLSKLNLARSIEGEVLTRPLQRLDSLKRFEGAGVYALYYGGNLPFYSALTHSLDTPRPTPIYVGKAIPKGGRTGGLGFGEVRTTALYSRLRKHSRSVDAAEDLNPSDFLLRHLVLDDVWIPLGENMLIESYQPVWNKVVAGFGNNPPGAGRVNQRLSLWDILHPGRAGVSLAPQVVTRIELQERVAAYLRGESVPIDESRDPADSDDPEES